MKVNDYGANNQINIMSDINVNSALIINIHGSNNNIFIGENCLFKRMTINISGDMNRLVIKDSNNHRGLIHLRHGSEIIIKELCTSVDMNLFALEGKKIEIGKDCMFSSRVFIRNSDEHSILDYESGIRLNSAQDVIIGDHVWLGENVTVNKGVRLEDDIVVGSNSVVTKSLRRSNSVYVGNPARLIRESITWDRRLL